MNIDFGNRLAALRKERNMSQEDLAERLGVSRQAVSKWENGEASPDTDKLIALSDLFGISLDELVGKQPHHEETVVEGEVVDPDEREDDDDDDDDEHRIITRPEKVVSSIGFILAIVAYLIIGFTFKGPTGGLGWASCWVVFFVPIVLASLVSAIRQRRMGRFQISLLVIGVYCCMGIIGNAYGLNLWHPYWALFFLIPIYHMIAGLVDPRRMLRVRK